MQVTDLDSTHLKRILFYITLAFCVLGNPLPAESQPREDSNGDYVNLGNIAFSSDYQLAEDRSFIIFKIKNQEYRTLSHIFGWVYRTQPGNENTETTYQLMNNPHQAATLIQGGPHRPGAIAEWRFIFQKKVPANAQEKFILRVSPKSLFYTVWEPPLKSETNKKR